MVTQKCPRCASGRVRRGYRPTPIWSKVLFRYNLLCDNCNWEFTGFAVPGTVSTKPTKKPKKAQTESQPVRETLTIENEISNEAEPSRENIEELNIDGETGAKAKKKRVKIKL